MSIKVSWGNSVREFQQTVKKTEKITEDKIQNIVDNTAKNILNTAKILTPVKSGKLKRAWKYDKSGSKKNRKVIVSNPLEYAPIIEYGSKKTPPRRMLSKAMKRGSKYMNKELDKLGKEIEGTFNNG